MEENDNLLPLNDNDNNINQNILQDNPQLMNNELKSEDYQIIAFNGFPSTFYCIIISIILCFPKNSFYSNLKENEDTSQFNHVISYLKIMLIIYTIYIIKAIFYYFLAVKIELHNTFLQILISILYFIIDFFYYFATIAGYYSFKRISLDFIINNIYTCIFIYCIIFIGIVHICLFAVSCIYIIVTFIISLNNFLNNEMNFIIKQGELPSILEELLETQKADGQYCKECYICLEKIEKGQEIIILKCNKNHFFHSECIKKWLKYSISCPLCRQQNII